MLSVITPTFNTPPEVLARTWASLKAQTFRDFEWVVYDDSPGHEVSRQLYGYCSDERFRIRVYRPHMPSGGRIGYVKRCAFGLGLGDVLVELDHDDVLLPTALAEIASRFAANPLTGFVHSDWAEVHPNGQSHRYPAGWGFGVGTTYWSEKHGLWVSGISEVNKQSLSHIVSVPNHVRAWRASVYRAIGGHDPNLEVADDYDLLVRTALETNLVRIPELLYIQYLGDQTAQRVHNARIQQLVPRIHEKYRDQIFAKFTKTETKP